MFLIAEQIERNGAQFYRKAAESAPGEKAREMLLDLAAMEDEHQHIFAEMRKSLTPEEKAPTVFDPDDKELLYLWAMADGRVFDVRVNPAERLTGNEPVEDIVKTAIGLEKDSIVFYLGMKKFVPEAKGGGRLDDIISEEMQHIAILSSWQKELKQT
jgi:rubrerythrin